MNVVLLSREDFVDEACVELGGRRATHVREVHRAEPGRELVVGLIDGALGTGRVLEVGSERVRLEVLLDRQPPPPLELGVVLALPRPKVLRRVLAALTSFGIKRIELVNAFRVEKSYWQSEELAPQAIREACLKGLEQARDTMMPAVGLHPRFRPFVEDELPSICAGGHALVGDGAAPERCPAGLGGKTTLALGPEGGFIAFELELLRAAGFTAVSLGPRVLAVETAAAALVGRLLDGR